MFSSNSNDSSIKYHALVDESQGVVIGDHAHVEQHFYNSVPYERELKRVPFMAEDIPTDFVERPHEFEKLIKTVLDEHSGGTVAITTVLRGAGGYGKTTIAKALCHDERIQKVFYDGILWVTLGEKPSNLVEKLEDLIYFVSRERPRFNGIDFATAYFAELLLNRHILLVIDDVWDQAHLKPFLQGGKNCARLITTRYEGVVPTDARCIHVDSMRQEEAIQLLSAGVLVSTDSMLAFSMLSARLGEWPLLLKLVNAVLRERIQRGQSLSKALSYITIALDRRGLTFFDNDNTQDRSQAVKKTLQVSFEQLSKNDYMRYSELAVFPEDVDIPLSTVQKLWNERSGIDDFDTEALCERLQRLSLLLHFDLITHTIRLHDVIRTYLQQNVGEAGLLAYHKQLLDAYKLKYWSDLSHDEFYLWRYIVDHLIGAGRNEELITTVKDPRYLVKKIHICGVYALETDLSKAEKQIADLMLNILKRNIAVMSHLLSRCMSTHEIAGILYSRLSHLPEVSDIYKYFDLSWPSIVPWHTLPDLAPAALIRTLQGHQRAVVYCAVSPSGDWIVSASYDGTLKVWDVQTGAERFTIRVIDNDKDDEYDEVIYGCAISPSGDWIVSGSHDGTLKVWDVQTGAERLTIRAHEFVTRFAISPSGDWIVSGSHDGTLKVWDVQTGAERLTIRAHKTPIWGCAVSPSGDWIVSASYDGTLKVWDVQTGVRRLTIRAHKTPIWGCAVSPSGDWIVSASDDGTLKVWDAQTGVRRLTIRAHKTPIWGCAVSPSGDWIVSGSQDGTLKVWDAQTGVERLTIRAHDDSIEGCAISPSGDWIVSASDDGTLKVWDVQTESPHITSRGHSGIVRDCAVSPSGEYVVSASEDHTLKLWNLESGTERFTLAGHTDYVNTCAISPSGDWIVSASYDGTLKVWDVQTGVERFTIRGHRGAVRGCAISPSGDWIVSSSNDKTLRVWDAKSGARHLTLRGHTEPVGRCAISPSGDWIVSASYDKTLRVWDMKSGARRLTLRGHKDGVTDCAISPSGDWIVSGSQDGILKIWDVQTGVERFTICGHTEGVNTCSISPSGKYIVSVSWDRTLKIWETETMACLATMYVEQALQTCVFCPDENHIVAGGGSGVYFLRLVSRS